MNADVVIVGGGLSGSALAIDLGRRGLSVIVCERAELPRDKPCGEGLLADGVQQLRTLLGELPIAQRLDGVVYHDGSLVARGDFGAHAFGLGVRRLHLDHALHARAVATPGVTVVRGDVMALSVDDRRASVALRDGRTVTARALVGADGPRSFVRRALGLGRAVTEDGRYALRRHFRAAAPTSHVHVSFHGDYELYVTPVGDGIVSVTALCARRVTQEGQGTKGERLARLFAAAPASVHTLIDQQTPLSEPLACGPLRARATAVSRGAALLVGDAAGYVDAITGEGMSLGLRGAAIAASALHAWLTGGARRERALLGYAEERARLVRTHVLITRALVAIAAQPKLRGKLVRAFAAHPDTFARWLEVSHAERSLLRLPPRDLLRLASA